MVTFAAWRPVFLCCCLFGLMLLGQVWAPAAHADFGSQVVLSVPGSAGNGPLGGPVGMSVHLAGSGFGSSSTISLYTTTNNQQVHCRNNATDLTPFTQPTVTAQKDGTFAIDTSWPSSAGSVGTTYYICAIPNNALFGAGTVSTNNFTVSPPPTISVTPAMVMAGGQVTVNGINWLPPQAVTITISSVDQGTALISSNATSDQAGNFSAPITIPNTAQGGSYTITVVSDNNPNLKVVANSVLTITSIVTPTPTVAPTPTPTATPLPTATPTTPTLASSSSTSTPPPTPANFVLITLGGLGILLVIVGVVLFVMYSRQQ